MSHPDIGTEPKLVIDERGRKVIWFGDGATSQLSAIYWSDDQAIRELIYKLKSNDGA